MERLSSDSPEALPDAVQEWAEELLDIFGPNGDGKGIISGFSRGESDENGVYCQVYVMPKSDISDQELFPREIAGMPVVYVEGGPFEAYSEQAEAA